MKNASDTRLPQDGSAAPPLLITGRTGALGQASRTLCHLRGLAMVYLDRAELDITDAAAIAAALRRYQPWAVVNTAGYVRVDDAETDAARCYQANTTGPTRLTQACAAHNLPFLTFSSDLVFDGRQTQAYLETDRARPLNVYGRSNRHCALAGGGLWLGSSRPTPQRPAQSAGPAAAQRRKRPAPLPGR